MNYSQNTIRSNRTELFLKDDAPVSNFRACPVGCAELFRLLRGVQPQKPVNLVIHFSEGLEDQERGSDVQVVVAPLLFGCAKTVSELHAFQSLELLFERKQIPQIVVNFRSLRKTTEPLEITRVPWAQGVGRSNRPAPTITY
jgi:hypothetical protein